jgi:type III secretory pathway component EscU
MITEGKVIRSTTIDSLSEFINKYKNMNFVGDQTVADQLESLQKEVLSMNSPTTFADDESVKMELHRRLIDIATVASNMADIGTVTGGYKRRISWED